MAVGVLGAWYDIRCAARFDALQAEGVTAVDTALRDKFDNGEPGDKVVVVGYSSGANAVIKEIHILDAAQGDPSTPTPDQVSFIVFGSPNRPNGGIFARLPGLYVPIFGITSDGVNPDTDYDLTDISWKWDPISDFPLYPLNPFAAVNTLLAFYYLHSFYYAADVTNADPTFSGTAPDGTKYITIIPKHLPLLQPFYDAGLSARPLDALEPVLTQLVELSYDRTIPVWQNTPASLLPPPEHVLAALPKLRDAVIEGAEILSGNEPQQVEGTTVDQQVAGQLSAAEQPAATESQDSAASDPAVKVKETLTAPVRQLADQLENGIENSLKDLPKPPRLKLPHRVVTDRPGPVRRVLHEVQDTLSHKAVRPQRPARHSAPAS